VIVSPLPGRPTGAIRDALLSHGWEGVLAAETSAALECWGYHLEGLDPDQVEALMQTGPRFGLDVLTGADWAVLTGTRSRLSAMARSWSLPEPLRPLVVPIGQALPADPATVWVVRDGPVEVAERGLIIGVDVAPERYVACRYGRDDLATMAARAEAQSLGLVIRATDAAAPTAQLALALDETIRLGMTQERIALDPAWAPGSPDPGAARALGRPIVCATNDPVQAALAWERGARIFETGAPEVVRAALDTAWALGA
jgi:hypothetical protein